MDVEVAKYYEDAIGNKTEVPFNFSVDIGLFVKKPSARGYTESDVIIMEKYRLNSGKTKLEFIVDKNLSLQALIPIPSLSIVTQMIT